jgi:Tfp pilus assembly protein PilF
MSLTDRLDEQHARLVALEAFEVELTDGTDAALQVLGAPSDPIRMQATLAILLRAGRYQVAADLIRDQRLDDKWVNLAALVFAFLGDISRARSCVESADNSFDATLMRSARLAFAEGVIEQWRKRRPAESPRGIRAWSAQDIELAKTIIDLLQPLLSSVRAKRKIDGDFEQGALTYATYCAEITKNQELLLECVGWLIKHVPLPLVVAEFSLRGLVPNVSRSLPNRLCLEHSGEFQASFLAAMMERELFGEYQAAFEAIVKLSTRAENEEQKEAICIALFETCGQCGVGKIEQAIEIVAALRPDDSRPLGLLHAIKHLTEGNLPGATSQLDAIRDETDGVWWQARAQVYEKAGEEEAAQLAWEKASQLLPHPDVIRRSIRASIDRRKYQSAARELRKLLEHDPNNEQNLKAMAWAVIQLNDHAEAVNYLKRLVAINSSNSEYRLWLAQSLARTAQIHDAIQVLQPVCESDEPPLEAILLQSELLETDNKAAEGFRLLRKTASDYWDDPTFLLTYMHRGHAAGEDRLAHEAFARLLELQREGQVPPELMQERTLEDLLEHARHYQSRRETLQQEVIAGRLPWLLAEGILGNPPTWAWALHTQELKWLSEEPLPRAALSIYATNGFTVQSTGEGKSLEDIIAPEPGSAVVADLSALLTLHKLGLLEEGADYFGYIVLPANYGDLQIRYAHKFSQHQPSREAELRTIRTQIDSDRIQVIPDDSSELPFVDEYLDNPGGHAYRLKDFIPLLQATQKVAPSAIEELRQVAHESSTVDPAQPSLVLGQKVLIDLMTLRTLANQTVLEPILESFVVGIRNSQYQRIIAELQAHDTARAAKSAHDDLWHTVADLATRGKIRWQGIPADQQFNDESHEGETHPVYLDAVLLAKHLKLPLLVDDRVLQVLVYQENSSSRSQAFGSDCLLRALATRRVGNSAALASDFRRLMTWRYRFLVPSPDLLFSWAEESVDNLPGPALLDAAAYVHDCLRDRGLHCGLEQSDPPMSLAAKFVVTWLNSIAVFLARVWKDNRFSDEKCSALTRWVGEELVPSCPRGLWLHQAGHALCQAERSSVFGMAMVQFTGVENPTRANQGLRVLAEALGIQEDQYLTVVAAALHNCVPKEHSPPEIGEDDKRFSRRMMQNALLHYEDAGFDALTVSRLKDLRLLTDLSPPTLPETLLTVLRSMTHSSGTPLTHGPLIFIPEDAGRASVVEIDMLLLHPNRELRQAALEYLQVGGSTSDPWITPVTAEALRECSSDVQVENESRWRAAANRLATAIREDFFSHLAALRQSIASRYQEGISQYLGKIMHPALSTLLYLRPPLWSPTEQRDEVKSWITEVSMLPSLEAALTSYTNRCGYIPVCAELGVPEVVKQWMARHPDQEVNWGQIWTWALGTGTPLAKYQALTVGLHFPNLRPSSAMEEFWREVLRVIDVTEDGGDAAIPDRTWQLYCRLASHFSRHIEALHPGQHGERVACYAWWLTQKVGKLLGSSETQAKGVLEEIVSREDQNSYFRWTVSRSPVAPSPFRHATINLSSVWSMAFLAHISLTARSFESDGPPAAFQERVGRILHGYMVASPLTDSWERAEVVLAFQDNAHLEALFIGEMWVPQDKREACEQLMLFHRQLASQEGLEGWLTHWNELPPHLQHLTILALKEAVFSTTRHDDTISRWIEETSRTVEILLSAPETVVEHFLEMLEEFQQHQVGSWPVRLPHLLAFAVEEAPDGSRIEILGPEVLQMSINAGIASPIQRLVHSKKWAKGPSFLGQWRENLLNTAQQSEAWVAARIRATSATVSRLIGPRVGTQTAEKHEMS